MDGGSPRPAEDFVRGQWGSGRRKIGSSAPIPPNGYETTGNAEVSGENLSMIRKNRAPRGSCTSTKKNLPQKMAKSRPQFQSLLIPASPHGPLCSMPEKPVKQWGGGTALPVARISQSKASSSERL